MPSKVGSNGLYRDITDSLFRFFCVDWKCVGVLTLWCFSNYRTEFLYLVFVYRTVNSWSFSNYRTVNSWSFSNYRTVKFWSFSNYRSVNSWSFSRYRLVNSWSTFNYRPVNSWSFSRYRLVNSWSFSTYRMVNSWSFSRTLYGRYGFTFLQSLSNEMDGLVQNCFLTCFGYLGFWAFCIGVFI